MSSEGITDDAGPLSAFDVMLYEYVQQQLSRHRERNRELRARLEERHVDFTEVRPIEFYFWARSQRDAAVLGRALYEIGFLVRLLAPAPIPNDAERWSVEAGAKIPLAQALSDDLVEKLLRLAFAEDAVFDGWGASF